IFYRFVQQLFARISEQTAHRIGEIRVAPLLVCEYHKLGAPHFGVIVSNHCEILSPFPTWEICSRLDACATRHAIGPGNALVVVSAATQWQHFTGGVAHILQRGWV